MRDVLEMANVFTTVEIERDERISIQIIAGSDGTVEVGRRVADGEVNPMVGQVHRWVLPHPAAEPLIGIAILRKRCFLRCDIAMHIATGSVCCRPYANRVLGSGSKFQISLPVSPS